MDILIWTFLAIVLLLNYPSIVPYLVGINKARRIWNAKSQIIPAVVTDELKICMCVVVLCMYCDCLMKKLSRYFYFDQCGVGQWLLELMIFIIQHLTIDLPLPLSTLLRWDWMLLNGGSIRCQGWRGCWLLLVLCSFEESGCSVQPAAHNPLTPSLHRQHLIVLILLWLTQS